MTDARIAVVADVLREHGHNATGSGADTDTLATAIVNALDGASPDDDSDDAGATETEQRAAAATSSTNPETPVGTGREGGASNPAQ